ncbi:unnamed protein product, partial [Chrysoparadoxa australica]
DFHLCCREIHREGGRCDKVSVMCTIDNLILGARSLLVIRLVIALYLIISGSIIVNNIHLKQAYGGGVTAAGAFGIICGFMTVFSASVMYIGAARHNKAVLTLSTILEVVISLIMLSIGGALYNHSQSPYSLALQSDCLTHEPSSHTLEECDAYIKSDRFAALSLVWRSFGHLSLDQTKYYQRLLNLQTQGSCCGLGPPLRCSPDPRSHPRGVSKRRVVWGTDERITCGEIDGWWVETYFCSQFVDDTALFPEFGGCRYDYPLGDCMELEVGPFSKGCGAELEEYMSSKISGTSVMYMAMSCLSIMAL